MMNAFSMFWVEPLNGAEPDSRGSATRCTRPRPCPQKVGGRLFRRARPARNRWPPPAPNGPLDCLQEPRPAAMRSTSSCAFVRLKGASVLLPPVFVPVGGVGAVEMPSERSRCAAVRSSAAAGPSAPPSSPRPCSWRYRAPSTRASRSAALRPSARLWPRPRWRSGSFDATTAMSAMIPPCRGAPRARSRRKDPGRQRIASARARLLAGERTGPPRLLHRRGRTERSPATQAIGCSSRDVRRRGSRTRADASAHRCDLSRAVTSRVRGIIAPP